MALGRDGRSPATLDLNQGIGGKAENRSRLMTPIWPMACAVEVQLLLGPLNWTNWDEQQKGQIYR
jgi:hypothetical protein